MICLINHSMVVHKISHVMCSSDYISRWAWLDVYGIHTWSGPSADTAHDMSDQPQHSGVEDKSCHVQQ